MVKRNKWIILLMISAIALSLVGCKITTNNKENNITENVTETVETTEITVITYNTDYIVPDDSDFTWKEIDGGVAITGYTGTEKNIVIPGKVDNKTVKEIGAKAFTNTKVISVKLPATIEKINSEAFRGCKTLTEFTCGENVKTIGKRAFEDCTSLTLVGLNHGLITIEPLAFAKTSSLKSISIPSTVTTLNKDAFCFSGVKDINEVKS